MTSHLSQPIAQPTTDGHRPLSYEDLRRFLLLVVALLLVAALLRALTPILLLFTTVFLLAMVLNPLVSRLERRGVRRGLAVVVIVFLLLAVVGLALGLVVPLIMEQAEGLIRKWPVYKKSIEAQSEILNQRFPGLDRMVPELDSLTQAVEPAKIVKQVLRVTRGLMGGLFISILALLLLVFILSQPRPLVAGFLSAVPERHREAAGRSLARIMAQMTAWMKATLINGAITGVSTGILLHLIGVQPALVFGTLAFFGEFVPNIGPLVAAAPALVVALGEGPGKALMALAVVVFVQQVESNLLVPFIMGREMKLHPVSIIFFALAMASLFGVIGAVLAVPAAAIIKVLFDEFYLKPQQVPVQTIETQAGSLVAEGVWPDPQTLRDETDEVAPEPAPEAAPKPA